MPYCVRGVGCWGGQVSGGAQVHLTIPPATPKHAALHTTITHTTNTHTHHTTPPPVAHLVVLQDQVEGGVLHLDPQVLRQPPKRAAGVGRVGEVHRGRVRHAVRLHHHAVARHVGDQDVQQLVAQARAVDLGVRGWMGCGGGETVSLRGGGGRGRL